MAALLDWEGDGFEVDLLFLSNKRRTTDRFSILFYPFFFPLFLSKYPKFRI